MPSMLPDGLENEEPRLAIARLIEEIRRLWLALQGSEDAGAAPDGTVASEPTASGSGELQWSAILGKPDLFPPTAHSHAWATDITGIPSQFPSSWSLVSGKPSTFTPSAHTHGVANITGMTVKSVMVSDESGAGSVLSPTALLPSTLMWDGGDLTWNALFAYNSAAGLFYFSDDVVMSGGYDIWFTGAEDGTGAALDGSSVVWNYDASRRAAFGFYDGGISLTDMSGANPDGNIPLKYTPNATDASRRFDILATCHFGSSTVYRDVIMWGSATDAAQWDASEKAFITTGDAYIGVSGGDFAMRKSATDVWRIGAGSVGDFTGMHVDMNGTSKAFICGDTWAITTSGTQYVTNVTQGINNASNSLNINALEPNGSVVIRPGSGSNGKIWVLSDGSLHSGVTTTIAKTGSWNQLVFKHGLLTQVT